jgi:3-phosphoshikimate 1-carboxyvinyltransferase
LITLKAPKSNSVSGKVNLPASKSISNRVLIIDALCSENIEISNLSEARDTVILKKCLRNLGSVIDVQDAGTTCRFLTAYLSLSGFEGTMTGSDRMKERPIHILVNCLNELGAKIEYQEKEGYLPLRIHKSEITGSEVSIDGSVSSQYISALLLIAPSLPNGLTINIKGILASKPYVDITLGLMEYFGVSADFKGNTIKVEKQKYKAKPITIENDWSAASYFYSIAVIAEECELELPGLFEESLQGDSKIAVWMESYGIESKFSEKTLFLSKKRTCEPLEVIDFKHQPDLAQTFLALHCAIGHNLKLKGVESLKIKETDRIKAMQIELKKFGAHVIPLEKHTLLNTLGCKFSEQTIFTYHDHRMAMSIAPLVLLAGSLHFEDEKVVEKSFPNFWKELEQLFS